MILVQVRFPVLFLISAVICLVPRELVSLQVFCDENVKAGSKGEAAVSVDAHIHIIQIISLRIL